MSNVAVIMPAAGASRRFHDKNYKKPFAPLAGRAVWLHAAEKFLNRSDVKQVIVVIADKDTEEFQRKFGANIAILGIDVCRGGQERADSVEKGLAKVKPDIDLIAVHDAARPCLADKWIDAVFEAAAKDGAAILAIPETATLKRVNQGKITETVNRDALWQAQTPQVFRRDWLVEAYAARDGKNATDDAALIEMAGHPVSIVEGSPMNLKITTRDDLKLAEQVLKILPKPKLDGFANPFAGDDMWR
ncbi:2-C-methyl-D-erythritol 4-phosphate cytidylyltransferase [Bythopirellula polymerisocia]|uniref:2-C-methyl-D-erythritol 4-phosphate cytidylyltransferase n=1 Tax=Bythopirellula polymerisocia TaxID=2528003 RepID=A0A5C6CLJ3_9BACT|nr:2-C-methyl-D-erythritol 4-phosphate cytidylyltransferase [Bythopirellula polymerisocia]TWU25763.1 2-C-methyl-D-erythritol 4-phosphate cytidylyltransferase [Bythopirellula polymerisocia]